MNSVKISDRISLWKSVNSVKISERNLYGSV